MHGLLHRTAGLMLGAAALALGAVPALAQSATPTIEAVPGKPTLMLANYDLAELGYQVSEAFLSGTATSYTLPGAPTADGVWNASPAATAPFKTRVVVVRPSDPARFNGTVLVEWLNVTAGQDAAADWMIAHREMIRKGYAYVGVTAQKVGIDGGGIMGQGSALRKADAARYGSLSHPGDAWSYDIYSQVGRALKSAGSGGLLGSLAPRRVIAIGESQSAAFLTTYVNAVDRLARVYDGFFVHSRFGSASSLSGVPMGGGEGGAAVMPPHVRFRPDLRVPVLTVITETDLAGARLSGYHGSRRRDDARLRVWEVAGTAHADSYMFGGAFIDSGKQGSAVLAKVFQASKQGPMGAEAVALNPGMPHHYVTQAALAALESWVRTGRAPASTRPMQLAPGGKDGEPALVRNAQGIAQGGVRTPWTDVPTVRLSGKGDPKSFIGMLAGSGEPLTRAELATLYPGGKAEYLRRFTAALDAAIRAGHVLRDDRQEILEIAAINFDAAP
ncbi:MAG: alpha/beta hydrolase domain-containing protein [Novosphingobium sp.]